MSAKILGVFEEIGMVEFRWILVGIKQIKQWQCPSEIIFLFDYVPFMYFFCGDLNAFLSE